MRRVCPKFKTFVPFKDFLQSVHGADPAAHLSSPSVHVRDNQAFEEMRQHLLTMYRDVAVSHSFVLNSQHFDCVLVEQQPSVRLLGLPSTANPPELGSSKPVSDGEPEDSVTAFQLDLGNKQDEFGNSLVCEDSTIPMRRITLENLTRFPTLRHYFDKGPNGSGHATDPTSISPPSPAGHLHVKATSTADNLGGESYLNLWSPRVGPDGVFSLSQQWWFAGQGPNKQTVEGGWQVYPSLYGTENASLFVYWTADDYNRTGCYNLDCPGFVQRTNKWILGAGFPNYSTPGGTQYGFTMLWELFQGNWWLKLNNDWVGYYPGSIYQGGQLAKNAQYFQFGGETDVPNWACYWFSFCPTPVWPPMGSGAWSNSGYRYAAY